MLISKSDEPRGCTPRAILNNMLREGNGMKINITLQMGPTDFRAIRGILIAAALVLSPSAGPALNGLQQAAAQFSTWSSPSSMVGHNVIPEASAGSGENEVRR